MTYLDFLAAERIADFLVEVLSNGGWQTSRVTCNGNGNGNVLKFVVRPTIV